MASSLAPWLHKTLLKYSNTNGTDLDTFVGGVRVQILQWHTLESPFWASVGDQDYSIFARFSDESAAELLNIYDKRITSLKTSIVKVKSFRPLLVRPYEVSDKLELALFVDKFDQLGMDDEEIHFRETRTPLSACGGLLGEWIVKLRELHPNSKNGSDPTPSLSLKRSRASTEEAAPAVEDIPFVPPPVPLESAAPSKGLRIDPSLPELTVAEYLGSCWWNIAKKEQRKQVEQPADFLADVSDTDASVARELARDKEVTAVAAPPAPKPQRPRSPSSSAASSSEDEEVAVKPNRKLLASPLSPMPTSSPPRNQTQTRSPSHSPTPPSSSRTATHSSPPSQERPLRKSRTLSAALGASSGKNSLRSDGSMVLVEASDEEGEEEESPDKLADALLLSSGEPLFPAGQRSRMESPSTKQPLSSSEREAEDDDFEGDRSQSRSQEDPPVATFTSEIEGDASSSKRKQKEITSSNASASTSSSGIRKRQDGRDGRPNKMMRRTGPTADELELKGSITSLVGGPIELDMQGSASGSGTRGTGSSDERRRAFEAAGDEAMEVEEEEEVEEIGRSPRSSNVGEEILSRVGRDGEESGSLEESLSWERKGGSRPERKLEKEEEETQEDEVEQLEEVEMEQAEEEEEVGSLTQAEEEESFEHVVKTEPQSSPMKQGHSQTPLQPSSSPPRQSPPPPAPRPISPTPARRDRRGQAPPPSSGAFQQSSSHHPASSSPPHQTPSQVAPPSGPAIQWQKRVRSPTATPTDPLPPPPPAAKPTSTRVPAASTTQRLPSPPIKSPSKHTQPPIQGPSKPTTKVVASTANGKAPVVPGPPVHRRSSPPPPPLPSRVDPSPSTSKLPPSNPLKAASQSPPPPPPTTTLKRKADPSTSSSTAAAPPPPPPERKASAKPKSSSIYDPSKDPFATKKPTTYRRISSTFANEGASSRRSSTSSATPRSPSVAERGEALPREEMESPTRAAVVASALPFAKEVKIESPSSRRIVAGGEGASSSRGKGGTAAVADGGKASVVKKIATSKMERWELHLSTEKEVAGLSEEECREVSRLVSGGQ